MRFFRVIMQQLTRLRLKHSDS